jgi:peptidoglycan hydrolase CwlO-like protein
VLALGGGQAPAQLDRVNAKQDEVQSEIDQANREIDSLIAEEAALREREAAVADELAAKQAELDEATAELREAEAYLVEVRAELADAKEALSRMLVDIYKSNEPDVVDFVLSSETFSDAIAQAEYLSAVNEHQDAVITRVTDLRAEVTTTVERLTDARVRIESARDEISAHRDELAAAGAELEAQHADLAAAKAERRQTLVALQERASKLEREAARSAAPAAPDGGNGGGESAPAPNGATATLADDGSAIAPAGAPAAVAGAIAAANEIKDAPYQWGGGHGSFESSGYDCSGAVSYALHGGGLLGAPLDSGGLMSYGDAGAGEWITVYANPGHAYVVIAGLRFDTSGSGGSGPNWYTEMRSPAGYVARHPPGL